MTDDWAQGIDNLDDLLIDAIFSEDIGTIANIIQAAREHQGTLFDRLSKGYHELCAKGYDPDDVIRLRGDDEASGSEGTNGN